MKFTASFVYSLALFGLGYLAAFSRWGWAVMGAWIVLMVAVAYHEAQKPKEVT
jgi:hypothetical protein